MKRNRALLLKDEDREFQLREFILNYFRGVRHCSSTSEETILNEYVYYAVWFDNPAMPIHNDIL
jgi:hypothetical protein